MLPMFSVVPYFNSACFNENPSMRAVAKIKFKFKFLKKSFSFSFCLMDNIFYIYYRDQNLRARTL